MRRSCLCRAPAALDDDESSCASFSTFSSSPSQVASSFHMQFHSFSFPVFRVPLVSLERLFPCLALTSAHPLDVCLPLTRDFVLSFSLFILSFSRSQHLVSLHHNCFCRRRRRRRCGLDAASGRTLAWTWVTFDDETKSVCDAFEKEDVDKDLGINPPPQFLQVRYPKDVVVKLGTYVTPRESRSEPVMSWAPVARAEYYSLMIIDPDNPQMEGQFVHLLRVNIPFPGRPGYGAVAYKKPFPIVPRTIARPSHRYIFLVYAQTARIEHPGILMYMKANLFTFKVADFVKVFPVENDPLAGNFMHGEIY